MTVSISVASIDNHPVVGEGLELYLLRNAPQVRLIASAASIEEYLASAVRADVVLLDLLLSDGESTASIPSLLETGAKVLLYTTEERPVPLRAAVAAGASGVLLKSDPLRTVERAIGEAMAGEFCCSGPLAHALLDDDAMVADLSGRQVQILQALDEGLDYRATSRVLGVSVAAVKTHLERIREKYRKAGIEPGNSHHLTRIARDGGYLR